ncbi:MAG: acetoacetate--CoA ligase [Gemmatimonadales bacterium]
MSVHDEHERRVMWRPSGERVRAANLTRFRDRIAARFGDRAVLPHARGAVAALHAWSVEEAASFWSEVWDFTGVIASATATEVVDDPTRMPGARWFDGARLNFAENLLADRSASLRRAEAIVAWNEEGRRSSLAWGALRREVARFAGALRRVGVGPGDRVAAFIPNIPEAIVGMLATSSLGAIWSSCSPDFGIDGVVDRFGPIAPKVLVTARGALWAGRWNDCHARARDIVERLPSLEAVVVADYGGHDGRADVAIPGARAWEDFLAAGEGVPMTFEQLPFDHPLYILYSSGTTGPPKGIVHGQGGTLLQHLKELVLHSDLRPGDALLYHTTTGWMMWNWMASALAVGATVVLYDGSPLHPSAGRMWDIAEAERLTHFGTSARYLAVAAKRALEPRATHDLPALRTILSTGSPLAPESFDWVYGAVKDDVHLASISGGTDIVSCFVLGDPTAPVHRGEIQSAGLGMSVEVWDEAGHALPPGIPGELVCTRVFPSMPVAFWNDPDGARYRASYFERFVAEDAPHGPEPRTRAAWRHGDWIERTDHGGFVIHGRSDATLNPGGVRIGTAEIYRQLDRFDEVVDAVVVGHREHGDERIVLFVAMRAGVALDDGLRARIGAAIRERLSPRHVPAVMLEVPQIPRTVSGKVSEVAVRRVIHGQPVQNAEALANPHALEHFARLRAHLRDGAGAREGSPRRVSG